MGLNFPIAINGGELLNIVLTAENEEIDDLLKIRRSLHELIPNSGNLVLDCCGDNAVYQRTWTLMFLKLSSVQI